MIMPHITSIADINDRQGYAAFRHLKAIGADRPSETQSNLEESITATNILYVPPAPKSRSRQARFVAIVFHTLYEFTICC